MEIGTRVVIKTGHPSLWARDSNGNKKVGTVVRIHGDYSDRFWVKWCELHSDFYSLKQLVVISSIKESYQIY